MQCGVVVYNDQNESYIMVGGRRVTVVLAKNTSEFDSLGVCPLQVVSAGNAEAMVGVCACGNFNTVGKIEGDDVHRY